jgi:hypothetical protein
VPINDLSIGFRKIRDADSHSSSPLELLDDAVHVEHHHVSSGDGAV